VLVLTRKRGEVIMIGDNIKITVVEVREGKVRLGIDAPKDVPIYRKEIAPKGKPKNDRSPEEPERGNG
jgi:carbon storage regulator